jgi:hypothetical protein
MVGHYLGLAPHISDRLPLLPPPLRLGASGQVGGESLLADRGRTVTFHCKLCPTLVFKVNGSRHLRQVHQLSMEDYVAKHLLGLAARPLCAAGCGSQTLLISLADGFKKTCCSECSALLRVRASQMRAAE